MINYILSVIIFFNLLKSVNQDYLKSRAQYNSCTYLTSLMQCCCRADILLYTKLTTSVQYSYRGVLSRKADLLNSVEEKNYTI